VRRRLGLLLGESGMYDVRESDSDGIEELVLGHADGETVIR